MKNRSIDLRLALPAIVAWVGVAVLIGFPDALITVARAAAVVAVGAVALLLLLAVRRHRSRAPLPDRPTPASRGPTATPGLGAVPDADISSAPGSGLPSSAGLRSRPGPDSRSGLRTGGLPTAVLSLVMTAVVLTSAATHAATRRPEEVVEAAASGRYITAVGTVTQTVPGGAESFALTLDSIRIGDVELHASVPARAFTDPMAEALAIGSTVRVAGTLRMTEAGDATAVLLYTRGPPERLASASGLLAAADALRSGFRATVGTLPGDGAALLPGIAIGDTTDVDDSLDQAMKNSSLSHLTAVSGANCAVVIALVMLLGGAVGLGRRARAVVSVVVLVGFVVLVTPEPSVLRAAVMVGAVVVATASGRPVRGVPVVALAVLVLLVVDPWLCREYGFVLSVLATTGLLVLSGPLSTALSRVMPAPIAGAVAIPLAAQLACQPVIVLLQPSIPLAGVAANLLAGPAAPVATVTGLIGCLVAPMLPPLAIAVTWVAWVPSSWIAGVARVVSDLPGMRLPVPEGVLGVLLVSVATATGLVALLGRGRGRNGAVLLIIVSTVIGASVMVGRSVHSAISRPADWQIAVCDIGQGDAFVVRSADRIAVIDTGPDPDSMSACLDELGVERVDLLILSHFDLDHVGGTPALFGRVTQALVGPSDGAPADRLVAELAASGAEVHRVSSGVSGTLGELDWTLLWPPDPLGGVEPGNAASVTVEFTGTGCPVRCLHSIFLGDLGEDAQNLLLARTRLSEVDVVEVAHHGSADQSPRLYEVLSATVGLVGVGADNSYGHPNRRALDILGAAGTTVERTDRDGVILVAPAPGDGVRVWTENG